MKKSIKLLFAIIGLVGVVSSHALCGFDADGNYCESNINYVGFGVNGHPLMVDGVVYVRLTDDGTWYWDNSAFKNLTLSTLLTAKSTGAKIQIRWVSENIGPGPTPRGTKKIISVLLVP